MYVVLCINNLNIYGVDPVGVASEREATRLQGLLAQLQPGCTFKVVEVQVQYSKLLPIFITR